jgi:MoaA/NifB/PqqE/SkfB family radical SAM enzyme
MGSDVLSQMYHGMDSQTFVDRLTSYDNVTFLIGARSFDPKIENKYIPTKNPTIRGMFDYHASRNLAIERLCNAGMNSDPNKQHLAVIASPVGPETINDIFEMFQWSIERNIVPFVTVTMVSGKGHSMVNRHQEQQFVQKYQDLAVQIYSYLIDQDIVSVERLQHEGVSSYVGISPCNQLTHGLYIHYDGEVWRCPGNDTKDFIVNPNVRDSKLLDIWTNSINYRINKYNNRCVKDGITIPTDFYKNVLDRIIK